MHCCFVTRATLLQLGHLGCEVIHLYHMRSRPLPWREKATPNKTVWLGNKKNLQTIANSQSDRPDVDDPILFTKY